MLEKLCPGIFGRSLRASGMEGGIPNSLTESEVVINVRTVESETSLGGRVKDALHHMKYSVGRGLAGIAVIATTEYLLGVEGTEGILPAALLGVIKGFYDLSQGVVQRIEFKAVTFELCLSIVAGLVFMDIVSRGGEEVELGSAHSALSIVGLLFWGNFLFLTGKGLVTAGPWSNAWRKEL